MGRHEISGLNGRNRSATTSLRSESASGRKIGRVITKPDPDSADADLSRIRLHVSACYPFTDILATYSM